MFEAIGIQACPMLGTVDLIQDSVLQEDLLKLAELGKTKGFYLHPEHWFQPIQGRRPPSYVFDPEMDQQPRISPDLPQLLGGKVVQFPPRDT